MAARKAEAPVRDEPGRELSGDQKRAQQSQMEGPAAYAPHDDEPASADEAQKRRRKEQRQRPGRGGGGD
jgi:hypothetical protein